MYKSLTQKCITLRNGTNKCPSREEQQLLMILRYHGNFSSSVGSVFNTAAGASNLDFGHSDFLSYHY